jgi:GH35 family endo-1,4-beta-xylanase
LVSSYQLTTHDGQAIKVIAKQLDEQLHTTYNFEVADFHTYFVGEDGIWVHNVCLIFGNDPNQVYHAFRKTDGLGINRELVKKTIKEHFDTVSSKLVDGEPFNQLIKINGHELQYTAFKVSDDIVNVGRIHLAK